jgi:RNA polymerase sigma-70 factor, ECF subfamily
MSLGGGLDRAALEQLHRRLEKPLFNVVYRWVWNADEARDLVQDAFVRLWGHRREVDVSRAEPLLYRIALNLAANRVRRRRLWRWVGLESVRGRPSGESGAEADLAAQQTSEAVRQAVDALPERLRQVVLLCEFTGMGHREIAQTLGIPPGTVGSRRNAALKALGAALGRSLMEDAHVTQA